MIENQQNKCNKNKIYKINQMNKKMNHLIVYKNKNLLNKLKMHRLNQNYKMLQKKNNLKMIMILIKKSLI